MRPASGKGAAAAPYTRVGILGGDGGTARHAGVCTARDRGYAYALNGPTRWTSLIDESYRSPIGRRNSSGFRPTYATRRWWLGGAGPTFLGFDAGARTAQKGNARSGTRPATPG